jgi:hypothetical protein
VSSGEPVGALAQAGLTAKSGAVALATGMLALAALVLLCTVVGLGSVSLTSDAEHDGVSGLASRDIPPGYLALYRQAARRYGLDWSILAGIGRVECDHGRDPDPSCGTHGAVNGAGAGGPMQFLASTWARYGVDGDGDGKVDRWDSADAIFSAANYLRASGAPGDYHKAIYAYNHAAWYVAEVERWAARYRGSRSAGAQIPALAPGLSLASLQSATPTPVRLLDGNHAALVPGDGHLALVPAGAPSVIQAMVIAGNELQDLAYGPGGHPDPRGASEEDCSSTVNYVLYRSGVRPIAEIVSRNPLAQDYVSWGAPGPGRWVTIYSTVEPTPHTFMTIAGLRLDTSHNGTDVGPNRDQDGPRWRILDHIPTWAHWSVRHPPGL